MSDIASVNGLDFQDQRAATAGPPGMRRIQSINGAFKAVAPDGSTSSLGGTSLSDWYTQAQTFVDSLNASLDPFLRDDATSLALQLERLGAVSTGQVAVLANRDGGVISVKSGTTANSFRIMQMKDATNADSTLVTRAVNNVRTSVYAKAIRATVRAVNATCQLDMCSMTDGATGAARVGVYASASQANWSIATNAAVDTGVPFVIGTWYNIVMYNDGSLLHAYVGTTWANIAQIGTPQAVAGLPSATGYISFNAQNGATASNVEFELDKLMAFTVPQAT